MTVTAEFEDKNDFEGWNCGAITTCGKFGNVCGGYSTKASGHDIKKTFEVPEGTYWVTLDFIKIDSWLVKCRLTWSGVVSCHQVPMQRCLYGAG